MRAGGYTMWVVAALSIAMIVIAVRFLLRPEPSRLAVLRSLTWVQVLVIIGGVATNFISVCKSAMREFEHSGVLRPEILVQGTGEALTPAGMGFSLLAFVWLVIALAVRKAHQPDA
jgi:hypothetical protein